MAITIDYSTYTINIPRADMLLVQSNPTEIRQLNIDDFRQELNDLMDDVAGMPHPTNHKHTAPLTIAGVTLARVVEILSPYTVTFEDGQYNVNVVGGNSNVSDKNNKNQVGVNTANSAGLQDPFALQAAAFAGEVVIDVAGGLSGTTFPRGTGSFPVNNLTDALSIAMARGIRIIKVKGNLTLGSGDWSDGYIFRGISQETAHITLQSPANISNCRFETCVVEGILDNNNTIAYALVHNISVFEGSILNSGLGGTITLAGSGEAEIVNCYSNVSGGGGGQYPKINFNGTSTQDLLVRNYHGGLGLENLTSGTPTISLDFSSGRLVLENTMTSGTVVLRGIADIEDNAAGTTLDDQTITAKIDNIKGGLA